MPLVFFLFCFLRAPNLREKNQFTQNHPLQSGHFTYPPRSVRCVSRKLSQTCTCLSNCLPCSKVRSNVLVVRSKSTLTAWSVFLRFPSVFLSTPLPSNKEDILCFPSVFSDRRRVETLSEDAQETTPWTVTSGVIIIIFAAFSSPLSFFLTRARKVRKVRRRLRVRTWCYILFEVSNNFIFFCACSNAM